MATVYYLDDEVGLCDLVEEAFETEATELISYSVANDFLLAVKEKTPDLVILDYRLTDTTGVAVAAKVPRNIPRILVTGELSIPNIENIFDTIIEKPYRLSILKATVNEIIEK